MNLISGTGKEYNLRRIKRFSGFLSALAICLGVSFAQESRIQDMFLGGVPREEKTAEVMRLSLADAIKNGLR